MFIRQVLDSSLRLKKQNNSCLTPVISKTEIERNCPCGRPINISYSYSLCLCPACFIPNLKIGYVSPFIRKRIVVKARSIIGCGGGIIVTFISFLYRLGLSHFRHLYPFPIRVPSATIVPLGGGMDIVGQAEGFHGLLLENKRKQLYLLKPLGGSTSFLESKFFREIYNKTDFKNTYLDEFLGDAYTIINPYSFLVADYLAKSAGLSFSPSRIYYIPSHIRKDTVADGSDIQDRPVNLINVPDINLRSNLYTTEDFLDSLQVSKNYMADQNLYIRERIFDMWIGDWNKMNENWEWQSHTVNDSVIYTPIVIDRNHAFTKVDGVLFKQMLKMLSLDFICNYDSLILKDTKKINKLAFALDMAVAGRSDESVWIRQAQEIRKQMTDSLIDSAFTYLPEGVKHDEIELIKQKLKRRRLELEAVASQYYRLLQRTPVVAGTNQSDYFLIERQAPDRTILRIYDPETGDCRLEQQFSGKETKELWL